jgi:hypothetical protein
MPGDYLPRLSCMQDLAKRLWLDLKKTGGKHFPQADDCIPSQQTMSQLRIDYLRRSSKVDAIGELVLAKSRISAKSVVVPCGTIAAASASGVTRQVSR